MLSSDSSPKSRTLPNNYCLLLTYICLRRRCIPCDLVSRNSTFVTSSPATDTRVWARDAVKGKGGKEAGQNNIYPYPLRR